MLLYIFEEALNNTLKKNFNFTKLDSLKITYSLSTLLSEFSKFIFLSLIFYFFDYLYDFILFTFSLLIFRPQIGGLHFNSYIKCLSFTFMLTLLVIISKNFFILNTNKIFLLSSFNLLSIYHLAPLVKKYKRDFIFAKNSKKISLIAFIHFAMLITFPNNQYLLITIWALFFQSLQLIIGRWCERNEKKLEKTIKIIL